MCCELILKGTQSFFFCVVNNFLLNLYRWTDEITKFLNELCCAVVRQGIDNYALALSNFKDSLFLFTHKKERNLKIAGGWQEDSQDFVNEKCNIQLQVQFTILAAHSCILMKKLQALKAVWERSLRDLLNFGGVLWVREREMIMRKEGSLCCYRRVSINLWTKAQCNHCPNLLAIKSHNLKA